MPDKDTAFRKYFQPHYYRQLRALAGPFNLYRRFIFNYADITTILKDLLRGAKRTFAYPEAVKQTSISIKNAITKEAPLTHPDPSAFVYLTTDDSNITMGAVLQHYNDGFWGPLALFSARLQPAVSRYSTFGRELLVVCLAVRHSGHALEGFLFNVFTAHKPHDIRAAFIP